MKQKITSKLLCVVVTLCLLLLNSCEKDEKNEGITDDETYSCLIINMGNYSDANGGISALYTNGQVKNQLYQQANGEPLASIIESAVDCGSSWALLCSNEDKIELIDKRNFKSKAVIKGISTPRYGVSHNGYLYVTSVTGWDGSNGHIYQINLSNNKIEQSIEIEGIPEGIIIHNNTLWVASETYGTDYNVTSTSVHSYEINDEMKETVYPYKGTETGLEAKHIAVDKNGTIWVSLASYTSPSVGIAKVDMDQKEINSFVTLTGLCYQAHIYSSASGDKIYYLTDNSDEGTEIKTIHVDSKEITTVVKGDGFYGFGISPSGDIYTANINGFISNSLLLIYNSNGEQKNKGDLVGVGACRFLFTK